MKCVRDFAIYFKAANGRQKKKIMGDTIFVTLLFTLVGYSESLECYSCPKVANLGVCNVTRLCSDGQACYHNISSGEHSLGCVNNQKCDSHTTVPAIVGRSLMSRSLTTCFECCSTDHCNSALCRHPEPKVCIDDETVDCAKLNSIFSICNDKAHAQSVCAKFCGLCVVDGNWTLWSSWSKCDVTCGNGHQTRTRTCTNPTPRNGGLDCVGDSATTKSCHNDSPCPVHGGWSDWSHWGTCSVTCGMGQERRTRTCSYPPPSLAGNHCFGANTETQLCMPSACANGGWNDWTTWSTCSATCGGGIRSKSRSCTNPRPSPYGQDCVGRNAIVEICASGSCEINHCTTNPCVHGQCLDLRHDFLCSCYHGNTGRYCNISTGAHLCELNPCNYGTCVPGVDDYTCICNQGFTGKHCDDKIKFTDCFDVLHNNIWSRSGVYNVSLWKSKQVKEIYCDMDTEKGGWTVFQNRFDGSVNFTRTFKEYTEGFGSYTGEHWLGLKYIEEMASQGPTELRIDLTAADNSHVYEVFTNFSLGVSPGYELHIHGGTGTAGDTNGLSYNNGYAFYTYDHDNMYNCGHRYLGGWWYYMCAYANLNGKYFTPGSDHGETGMTYIDFKVYESLKSSRMMLRRT